MSEGCGYGTGYSIKWVDAFPPIAYFIFVIFFIIER